MSSVGCLLEAKEIPGVAEFTGEQLHNNSRGGDLIFFGMIAKLNVRSVID